jgi:hypothetical protein
MRAAPGVWVGCASLHQHLPTLRQTTAQKSGPARADGKKQGSRGVCSKRQAWRQGARRRPGGCAMRKTARVRRQHLTRPQDIAIAPGCRAMAPRRFSWPRANRGLRQGRACGLPACSPNMPHGSAETIQFWTRRSAFQRKDRHARVHLGLSGNNRFVYIALFGCSMRDVWRPLLNPYKGNVSRSNRSRLSNGVTSRHPSSPRSNGQLPGFSSKD